MTVAELGDWVEIVMGQAPPGDTYNKDGIGTPFVKAGEFSDRRPIIREWTTKPLRVARRNDTLVCVVGATAGKVNQGADCAIGRSVAAVRPDPNRLDSEFLYRFLATAVSRLRGGSQGAAQGVITREMIGSLKLDLPPLDEQRRIATILDHADAIRTNRGQALARLDELEQSIFLTMFGHDREMRPVSDLCELIVDCVNRTAPTVDGVTSYKMLRTTNVRNGIVDTSTVKYVTEGTFNSWNRRATPKRGDVLLTREAPVGEAGVLESDDHVFLGQRLMLYRVDPEVMTSEYLAACFRSPILQGQFARLGSGSTVKHLPLPACRSFQIPTAPVSAQRQYSARVATLSTRRAVVRRALATDNELFASLQSRAFRGEL